MRISSQQLYQQALRGLLDQQSALTRTQAQMATGERLLSPADDPAAAARIVETDRYLGELNQFDRNIDSGRSRLETEESILAEAGNLVQRAREIAVQAGNGSLSDGDRRLMSVELRSLQAQVVGLSNSTDAHGRYLFGGFADSAPPFVDSPSGVGFLGDQGRKSVEVAPGQWIADADSGFDVFMSVRRGNGTFRVDGDPANTGTGVIQELGVTDPASYPTHAFELRFSAPDTFDIVDVDTGATVLAAQPYQPGADIAFNGIRVAVIGTPAGGDVMHVQPSGNASAFSVLSDLADVLDRAVVDPVTQSRLDQSLGNAIEDLDQTMDRWMDVRTTIGARLQRLDQHADTNELLDLRAQESLSELRDLDYAEAVTRFTQYLTGLDAAQKTFAQVQSLSLFNRLP